MDSVPDDWWEMYMDDYLMDEVSILAKLLVLETESRNPFDERDIQFSKTFAFRTECRSPYYERGCPYLNK